MEESSYIERRTTIEFSKDGSILDTEGMKEMLVLWKRYIEIIAPVSKIEVNELNIKKDPEKGYNLLFLTAEWFIFDYETLLCISKLELILENRQLKAFVYWYNQHNSHGEAHFQKEKYESWEEGILEYKRSAKKWLYQYAPAIELPLPRNAHMLE